ncbi:MAG: ADP-ribosylglycohydrolase family protein [Clostridia bacterium]|nr:ADP-ribosylglycohydrolase family protein [Clostridia bacterium]
MLGAIIGDTVGSVFEFNNVRKKDINLFSNDSSFTDDSVMTLAVLEIIQKGYINDNKKIIEVLKKWGREFPNSGYGGMFMSWIFSENSKPYNSFGNGSAMRISPIGFYAKTEEEVKTFSKLVTEVTHNHSEGIKGAEVTAMCIYYAKSGKSKEFIKQYVSQYYDVNFNYEELKMNYRFNETCQETVPQAIYCFLISKDFEDCIRTSVSIGGDTDTLCAISCAIAEAYYKKIDKDIIFETLIRMPKEKNDCKIYELLFNYYKGNKDFESVYQKVLKLKNKIF